MAATLRIQAIRSAGPSTTMCHLRFHRSRHLTQPDSPLATPGPRPTPQPALAKVAQAGSSIQELRQQNDKEWQRWQLHLSVRYAKIVVNGDITGQITVDRGVTAQIWFTGNMKVKAAISIIRMLTEYNNRRPWQPRRPGGDPANTRQLQLMIRTQPDWSHQVLWD